MQSYIFVAPAVALIFAGGFAAGLIVDRPLGHTKSAPGLIVIDGDTLHLVDADLGETAVRLWGIDSPERGEPGWREARAGLALLVADGVRCAQREREGGVDRFGRVVATCWSGHSASELRESVNWAMVARGWARDMPKYSGGAFAPAEALAQGSKRLEPANVNR